MRKLFGVLLIIFLSFIGVGLVISSIGFVGDKYYGHLGYCNSTELTHLNEIIKSSLIICLFTLIYYIYLETFFKFKKHRKFYPYLLIFLLAFLGYLTYNFLQFPFLDRKIGFMGQSSIQEGIVNPIMNINIFYSVILLGFIIRFQRKNPSLKILSILSYLYLITVLITILLIYQNAEYEFCLG